jgi:hypothetical protein
MVTVGSSTRVLENLMQAAGNLSPAAAARRPDSHRRADEG